MGASKEALRLPGHFFEPFNVGLRERLPLSIQPPRRLKTKWGRLWRKSRETKDMDKTIVWIEDATDVMNLVLMTQYCDMLKEIEALSSSEPSSISSANCRIIWWSYSKRHCSAHPLADRGIDLASSHWIRMLNQFCLDTYSEY